MITEQLNNVIEKYEIVKTDNIIYGTNIPMPNKVIMSGGKVKVKFDKSLYYFFYFDEEGITLYSTDGEAYATIFWNQVVNFKISHVAILGKMTIETNDDKYEFQINRFVLGCPWIKKNTKYLEENNYFYHK